MTLRDELYTITASLSDGKNVSYIMSLHPESVIYKAHFPCHPITPGVCIIRVAVELAELYLNCRLVLFKVRSVKFLSVISPEKMKEVDYRLSGISKEADICTFQCYVTAKDAVLAKMSLICKKQ